MRLPPYPRYKPSGVEWLGEVPEHWEVKPLKYALSGIVSGGTPEVANEAYWANADEAGHHWVAIADMTRNPQIQSTDRRITEAGRASKDLRVVPPETLLYSMYASLGKVAVLEIPAAFNQAILALLPDKEGLSQGYLQFWLNSMEVRLELFSSSNTQDNLNAAKVRGMPLFLPGRAEQQAIADFLDRETARIDTLVAKKRTLIERLKEKRTALISRTVTRGLPPAAARAAGLDPHPKLKPSGIDWLGDVPEHWDIVPLKWRARCASGDGLPPDEVSPSSDGEVGIPVIGGNGLMGFASKANVLEPVLVIGRVGALCGNVHEVRPPAWVTDNALILKADSRTFDGGYLAAVLRSRNLNEIAEKTAQPLITGTQVRDQRLPRPAFEEQGLLARFLVGETTRIDAMAAKVGTAVERLQEYRTALITAAVTGKIDVRGADTPGENAS